MMGLVGRNGVKEAVGEGAGAAAAAAAAAPAAEVPVEVMSAVVEGSSIRELSLGSKSDESIELFDQFDTEPCSAASAAASWASSSNRRETVDSGESSWSVLDVGRCGVSFVMVVCAKGAWLTLKSSH